MSIVVIQIGQCGNQIGFNFFNTLSSYLDKKYNISRNTDNLSSSNKCTEKVEPNNKENVTLTDVKVHSYTKHKEYYQRFFNIPQDINKKKLMKNDLKTKPSTEKLKARAILIDSEVKVIKNIIRQTKGRSWQYNENNIYHEQIGAANNWSFGYYIHGPKAYEAIKDRIKVEVENCTNFDSFLIIQSLAGGTGSGLGSYFTEMLRKDYPYSTIVNLAVWPYQTGEVVVQNYNIILSIAHLYKYSDAILLIFNNEFHTICSSRLNYKIVSFQHINTLIADTMVNLFLNKKPLQTSTPFTTNNIPRLKTRNLSIFQYQHLQQKIEQNVTMQHLIQQLCPLPQYKLLSLKFVPQTSTGMVEQFNFTNWNGLLRSLSQMALTDKSIDEKLNWTINIKKPYNELTNPYQWFISNVLILRGKSISSPVEDHSRPISSSIIPLENSKRNGNISDYYKEDSFSNYDVNDLKLYKYRDKKKDDPVELISSQLYFNYNYTISFPNKFNTYFSHDSYKYSQSAYLISNSTAIIPKLEEVIEKVSRMYSTKAYIYQYNKYGLSNEHFEKIMLNIEQSK
ncbi:tubulin nucleotide-binding domain-like protein [Piromyces finnis]|uniref:Tubulin delta chain n=1 Tax=Piromyces finnis TaxID=1754191 RepID=A0A1Y1VMB1_9FUNG|nr:tubulin nucleotide-binding domain-like protein [Piromyces finnis]|eukprot:ORX59285.1 tubulin nucleotide-binding domain-like protein [Piromyces finnis]